jgi:uncharacterized protein
MATLYDYQNPRIHSLVFKLCEYCNQGCSYCYRENDKELPKFVMPDEIIKDSFEKYISFLRQHMPERKVAYTIWHGGEPLLAGMRKFETILDLQKTISINSGIQFINAVQTNGVRFDEDWARFFKRHNFFVGFSLDGPQFVHDFHRKSKTGKSTFDKTLAAVNLSLLHAIPTNVIGVITNESCHYPDQIYRFFKSIDIIDLDLIPCFDYDGHLTIEPRRYGSFINKIAELWVRDGFQPLRIRFLNDIRKRIEAGLKHSNVRMAVGCELAGRCGQNWSINGHGQVFACECLTPVQRFYLGDIRKSSFDELASSEGMEEVKKSVNDLDRHCLECSVRELCRGGCLNRRLAEYGLNGKLDLFCLQRKELMLNMKKHMGVEYAI